MISVALALMLLSQALVYGAAKTDCEKVSYKKLDLLFILDGSASVEAVNFVKTLNFVKNVVARLPIGAQETAVGVIQFTLLGANNNDVEGFKPRNEITLNSIQNRDQLIKKIGEIKYIEGCTLTNQAIWEGFKQFTIHGRKQVPKVMVVITDGKSSEKIDEAANNAHRAGITIISVGVGRAVDRSQLLKMAHNDTNRVFSIAKFNELVNFVDQLAMTIQKTIDPSCYSAPKVTLTPKPKGPFKHGQKVELECSIETVFTDIEYIFLKDEEVIPINLQKSTFRGGIKVRYSFTISTTTVGVYQCRTKTSWGLVSLSQKVEVLKKVNPDEGKPDAGTGKKDKRSKSRFDANPRDLCKRCMYNKCTLYDGEQCTEKHLDCNNEFNPKITTCGPGKLFMVDNVANGRTGSCYSAAVCEREKLLPWIRNISG